MIEVLGFVSGLRQFLTVMNLQADPAIRNFETLV